MSERSTDDLSRVYRAQAVEEPPEWLDQRVLHMAREELRAAPVRARRPAAARWGVGLALAATVVLSSSVVMLLRETPTLPDQRSGMGASSSPEAAESETKLARGDSTREAPPAAPAQVARAGREVPAATVAPSAVSPPTGVLEEARSESAPARPEPRGNAATERMRAAQPAAPLVEQAAPEPGQIRDAEILAESARREPAPSAKAGPPDTDAAQVNGARPAEQAARVAPSAERAAPAARAQSRAASTPLPPGPEVEPPQRWLERIIELRAQGQTELAQASLDAFRKRYPDYPLPETLK